MNAKEQLAPSWYLVNLLQVKVQCKPRKRKGEKLCFEVPSAAKRWGNPIPAVKESRWREGCRMLSSTCLLPIVTVYRLKSD